MSLMDNSVFAIFNALWHNVVLTTNKDSTSNYDNKKGNSKDYSKWSPTMVKGFPQGFHRLIAVCRMLCCAASYHLIIYMVAGQEFEDTANGIDICADIRPFS